METYILMGICLAVWLATVAVVKLLMRDSENAFVIGGLAGLLMAAAAGGAYYDLLSSTRI